MNTDAVEQRVDVFRQSIIALVHRDGPDLSARQMAKRERCGDWRLSSTYQNPQLPLDRLSEFDLVRRKTDPPDRRSVLVQRMAFLRDPRKILADDAGKGANSMPTTTRRPVAV